MTAIEEEELRKVLLHICRSHAPVSEDIEVIITLIKSREAALSQQHEREIAEVNELANAYARVIAAVYDGERVEDADKRIMAELQQQSNGDSRE